MKEAFSAEEQFIKPWTIDLADDHYPVDIAQAKQRLGWLPRHRLSATLQTIIQRLKADPQRWYEINNLGDPPSATVATPGEPDYLGTGVRDS
jgi:hypothetical protein